MAGILWAASFSAGVLYAHSTHAAMKVNAALNEMSPEDPRFAEAEALIHQRLVKAIPSIRRIDPPGQTRIPYGGTGFVVGEGLIMTNRHVAEIFAQQRGGAIEFQPDWHAAFDVMHERNGSEQQPLAVKRVRMIHPIGTWRCSRSMGCRPVPGSHSRPATDG